MRRSVCRRRDKAAAFHHRLRRRLPATHAAHPRAAWRQGSSPAIGLAGPRARRRQGPRAAENPTGSGTRGKDRSFPTHGASPSGLRGQGQDPLRGSGARHPRAVFQGRRDVRQRREAGHDHRQGRAEQPHQRIPDDAAVGDRRPQPLHPPPEHARAADPRSGDHPAGSRGAECRGGQPLDPARHPGRHAAAALDHRILLQERCAERPDGVGGAHHLLRLGRDPGHRRHRRADAPHQRFPRRPVPRRRHHAGGLQGGVRPAVGE